MSTRRRDDLGAGRDGGAPFRGLRSTLLDRNHDRDPRFGNSCRQATVHEKRRTLSSWLTAFWREGRQSGLFVGYVIGSLLAAFTTPIEPILGLASIGATAILVSAAIIYRLRKRIREDENRE